MHIGQCKTCLLLVNCTEQYNFTDYRLVAMDKIKSVFSEPRSDQSAARLNEVEMWEEKKAGYSLLLNCSDIDDIKANMVSVIKRKVLFSIVHTKLFLLVGLLLLFCHRFISVYLTTKV